VFYIAHFCSFITLMELRQGLANEVIQWLNVMELSKHVKNWRREFSNCALFGQIYRNYFPHDFELHSYDFSATTSSRKLANWKHFAKTLKKLNISFKGLTLSKKLIQNCIASDANSIRNVLHESFKILTKQDIM
jgi:CH-like domain in sperm protein